MATPLDTAALLEQIDELKSENRSVEETVSDYIKRRRADAQTRIAWVIVWAFVVAVAGIFLLVLGSQFGTGSNWKEPAEFLVGIVSSVLLPVVTLVLGYYFGKEKNE
ncbi:MAG: hypothetical protein JSU95_10260 [Betaproteobacteria bacterium]|nr:MAG: hypothetical protein JSU95_10260 [Betaproteobacteria bacterium]